MRENKFRAWDNANKEFHYWVLKRQITHAVPSLNGIIDYIVMQYTGLKDKNGKEIYEGDIVRQTLNTDEKEMCAVVFKNGSFGLYDGKGYDSSVFNYSYEYFEIVGNIYEDKELLK